MESDRNLMNGVMDNLNIETQASKALISERKSAGGQAWKASASKLNARRSTM